MTKSGGKDQNEGYVLISVLSVLALLSGLAAAMLLLSRTAVDTAVIAGNDLTADAMTQSAISLAGYQLFVLKLPADRVDGQQIRLDQGVISLSVSTDAGKVDLNGSGRALLAAAYRASGLTTMTPTAFAARVIDWRDGDDDVSKEGAEMPDYQAAGLDSGPRNGPFRSTGDLRWILGMMPGDVPVLQSFVTIYNPAGRLNVFATSRAILEALPGVDADILKIADELRADRNSSTVAKLEDLFLVQAALIDTNPPQTYTVLFRLLLNTSDRERKIEVILTNGVDGQPYQTLHFLGDG